MTMRSTGLFRTTALTVLMLSTAAASYAAGNDFKKIIKHLETTYDAKQKKIPFIGIASFLVKIVRPKGVKEFKFAIFEDRDFSARSGEPDPGLALERILASRWQPLVRSSLRKGKERTYVYVRPEGKDLSLLMLSLQTGQAVVIQAKINPETLIEWLQKTDRLGPALFTSRPDYVARTPDPETLPEVDQPSETEVAAPVARTAPVLLVRKDRTDPDLEEDIGMREAKPLPGNPDFEPARGKNVVKLEARLVNLNVKAITPEGKPITDLNKEDFLVFEDGVRQIVTHFEPVSAPVNMLLLLDLSGSTREKIKAMKKAAKNFVDSLGPEDRIAVAAFTRRFTLVSDFTADRKSLKKRIDGIKNQHSGTAYYDAMWAALDLLRRNTDRRKAMVVLTDGVDNSITYPDRYASSHSFGELSMRLAEEEATVYPIYFDTEYDVVVKLRLDRHASYGVARRQLQEVADQTGGLLFKAARVEDLNGVYERVAAELRTFYSLAYPPLNAGKDGGWRAISVEVDRPKARVRAKRGYYAR